MSVEFQLLAQAFKALGDPLCRFCLHPESEHDEGECLHDLDDGMVTCRCNEIAYRRGGA